MNGGISPSGFHEEFNTEGPVTVISQGGASAGYVTWMPGNLWVGAHCFVIDPKTELVDSRFLYHFLKHSEYEIQGMKSGAGIPGLNRGKLIGLRCPLPPMEVQREIVKILDTFTELEAELEAECEARKSQYEYYRSHLMTFSGDESEEVQLLTLGDICLIKTGQGISKEKIAEYPGPYPVINSGREPLGFYAHFNTENDPLGITSRGAGVGSITWCDEPYFRGNLNYAVSVRNENEVSCRYLYFWLLANQREVHKLCTFEAIPALNKSNLEKLEIYVPSLSKQYQIVTLLNIFEEFAFGLSAEISARRKQFEFYRNELLTFKGLEVA
jgi:type I restriction enzyme S subunit